MSDQGVGVLGSIIKNHQWEREVRGGRGPLMTKQEPYQKRKDFTVYLT